MIDVHTNPYHLLFLKSSPKSALVMANYFSEDNSEAYLGPSQKSMMEPFQKIIDVFLLLIFLQKSLISLVD